MSREFFETGPQRGRSTGPAGPASGIDLRDNGQADGCICPACAIASAPCLADPPPVGDAARAVAGLAPAAGPARGPVQDEAAISDPLDRRAAAEIESGAFDNRVRRR